jgi:hypothetical protein
MTHHLTNKEALVTGCAAEPITPPIGSARLITARCGLPMFLGRLAGKGDSLPRRCLLASGPVAARPISR